MSTPVASSSEVLRLQQEIKLYKELREQKIAIEAKDLEIRQLQERLATAPGHDNEEIVKLQEDLANSRQDNDDLRSHFNDLSLENKNLKDKVFVLASELKRFQSFFIPSQADFDWLKETQQRLNQEIANTPFLQERGLKTTGEDVQKDEYGPGSEGESQEPDVGTDSRAEPLDDLGSSIRFNDGQAALDDTEDEAVSLYGASPKTSVKEDEVEFREAELGGTGADSLEASQGVRPSLVPSSPSSPSSPTQGSVEIVFRADSVDAPPQIQLTHPPKYVQPKGDRSKSWASSSSEGTRARPKLNEGTGLGESLNHPFGEIHGSDSLIDKLLKPQSQPEEASTKSAEQGTTSFAAALAAPKPPRGPPFNPFAGRLFTDPGHRKNPEPVKENEMLANFIRPTPEELAKLRADAKRRKSERATQAAASKKQTEGNSHNAVVSVSPPRSSADISTGMTALKLKTDSSTEFHQSKRRRYD